MSDDFTKHRITGWVPYAEARGIDPRLDVPLITHVEGNLWQGGCPDYGHVSLPEGFDYVLSLYPWGKYDMPTGCERDEVRMYDSLDQGFDQVDELARGIKQRLDRGQTVLIHCQAGLNRSGLLTARVLTLMGKTAAEALALLRKQRSHLVVCNEAFEEWLLALDDEVTA